MGLLSPTSPYSPQVMQLLGMNPQQMQQQALWGALQGIGMGLLNQGPSQYPIRFGDTFAAGAKGGIMGAQEAQKGVMERALLGKQVMDAEAERKRQEGQDAWANTVHQRQTQEWGREDASRAGQESAVKGLMSKYYSPSIGNTSQLGAMAPKVQAMQPYMDAKDYGGAYQQMIQPPPAPEKPTSDMREYDLARQQGFTGTFQDYMTGMKRAGATSVNVNGDQKLTEGQSKDIGYYARGSMANKALNTMENSMLSLGSQMGGGVPVIGNYLKDPKYQEAERAGREVLAVILRKDTGAAVTPSEFQVYGGMYLPMPGDSPETVAAKRQARENALRAIRMGAGTARPLFDQIDQELNGSQSVPVPQPMGGTTSTGIPWSVTP
jgi:hypothetical protein